MKLIEISPIMKKTNNINVLNKDIKSNMTHFFCGYEELSHCSSRLTLPQTLQQKQHHYMIGLFNVILILYN